jgi:[acyl-carrier-protein] S-malonyltransferase
MSRLAYVFPGQGSQYAGMGDQLYTRFATAKRVFELSSDTLGLDMKKLCFEGSMEKLTETQYTQPAVLTVSYAAYQCFSEETGLVPDILTGHSLGEITALACAGAVTFEDALRIVKERGRIMQETSLNGDWSMAAIMGADPLMIEQICRELSEDNAEVYISNYNSTQQTVVSGHTKAIGKLAARLGDSCKVIPLNVSGPFHSPFMEKASRLFAETLGRFTFHEFQCPVISNVTGMPYERDEVPTLLMKQIVQPVNWIACMNYCKEFGVQDVIEFGPGKVLGKLVTANMPEVRLFQAGELQQLDVLKEEMNMVGGRLSTPGSGIITKCLAIAVTTQNYNNDSKDYHQEVVLPYRIIEQIQEKVEKEHRTATEEEQLTALASLEQIMRAKKVPEEEWSVRLKELELLARGSERLKSHIQYPDGVSVL